ESYLNPLGYMLLLCNSHHSPKKEEQLLQQLADRSVDGILLATPNILPQGFDLASDFFQKLPCVLIDRGINQRDFGRLIIKEYEGTYQAINYLIKMGHKNIGMIKEDTQYYQLEERYNAYADALKDASLPFKSENIVTAELEIEGGYQAAKKILRQKDLTAVFCSNDAMAVGCYRAVYEAGLRIPEDISVIGFDGLQWSSYLAPALTTIEQPIFEIGYTAAKFMVDAIEFPEQRVPNKTFATKIRLRESVKNLTQ